MSLITIITIAQQIWIEVYYLFQHGVKSSMSTDSETSITFDADGSADKAPNFTDLLWTYSDSQLSRVHLHKAPIYGVCQEGVTFKNNMYMVGDAAHAHRRGLFI